MQIGGLPQPAEADAIWEGIWFEETHNSTAIEGNTLVLKQVKTLLAEKRAVGEKELREYLEVQGYAEAARWVYEQAHPLTAPTAGQLITLAELREIHLQAVGPAWRHFPPSGRDEREGPGSFRRHDIEPFGGGMKPPPWPDVPPRVSDWLASANAPEDDAIHPVARLAALHAAFERIHPFRDGNGRTGRLALNLMLVRLGYPPAIVYKKDRGKYLRALERADKGDPGSLGDLLARSVTQSIHRFLLPGLAGPHRMIPISALADEDLSAIALRRAAERGRLRALRRTDQWYSTRAWVDDYKRSRRRGGPPKD